MRRPLQSSFIILIELLGSRMHWCPWALYTFTTFHTRDFFLKIPRDSQRLLVLLLSVHWCIVACSVRCFVLRFKSPEVGNNFSNASPGFSVFLCWHNLWILVGYSPRCQHLGADSRHHCRNQERICQKTTQQKNFWISIDVRISW